MTSCPDPMQPLHRYTRLLLAIGTLSLCATYFLPVWEIKLWAPQYPEGLAMYIWLDHISGDFDIINGLNHYIGMRTIRAEMFPEFRFMGAIVAALIAAGALPVITGRRRWLVVFAALLCIAGLSGMIDYYRWGYDYGHNLDPRAAISVPGMSYQPPIFGYKAILNFVAYAGPASGGWIFISVGALAVLLTGWEYRRHRTPRPAP